VADEKRSEWPYWKAVEMSASGAWAEKRRLAAAMRQVIERLFTSDAPEDELSVAADGLERYARRLETHPRRRLPVGFGESANAGDVGAFFDYSPMIGLSNPLSPPLRLRVEGGVVLGHVTFGSAYEGPPGHVHGGFVAAAFDEVLGFAQSITGNPGMTGTLTIRYRRPTPLHVPLSFEARVLRTEGRKIFTEGRLHAGETLCAEAEGLFVSVDFHRMRELTGGRGPAGSSGSSGGGGATDTSA
jgi:acyl-coenzyme A thioesterase PaaI-like protein